jgi:hypothetical protein
MPSNVGSLPRVALATISRSSSGVAVGVGELSVAVGDAVVVGGGEAVLAGVAEESWSRHPALANPSPVTPLAINARRVANAFRRHVESVDSAGEVSSGMGSVPNTYSC